MKNDKKKQISRKKGKQMPEPYFLKSKLTHSKHVTSIIIILAFFNTLLVCSTSIIVLKTTKDSRQTIEKTLSNVTHASEVKSTIIKSIVASAPLLGGESYSINISKIQISDKEATLLSSNAVSKLQKEMSLLQNIAIGILGIVLFQLMSLVYLSITTFIIIREKRSGSRKSARQY